MFTADSPLQAETFNPIVDEIDRIFKEEQERARRRAMERIGELHKQYGSPSVGAAMCEFAFRERMRRS
jgi:hypothetical protein